MHSSKHIVSFQVCFGGWGSFQPLFLATTEYRFRSVIRVRVGAVGRATFPFLDLLPGQVGKVHSNIFLGTNIFSFQVCHQGGAEGSRQWPSFFYLGVSARGCMEFILSKHIFYLQVCHSAFFKESYFFSFMVHSLLGGGVFKPFQGNKISLLDRKKNFSYFFSFLLF